MERGHGSGEIDQYHTSMRIEAAVEMNRAGRARGVRGASVLADGILEFKLITREIAVNNSMTLLGLLPKAMSRPWPGPFRARPLGLGWR